MQHFFCLTIRFTVNLTLVLLQFTAMFMKSTLLLTVIFLFVSIPIFAQGDLSVVPRRVIFDNFNKRSETLYLTNRGSDSATYNISYLNYELDEYGQFREVPEDSVENPASKNFRVFPRRVTLAPNFTTFFFN